MNTRREGSVVGEENHWRGVTRDILQIVWKNKLILIASVVLLAIIVTALIAPWLTPYSPDAPSPRDALQPPSRDHFLGTDEIGRDIATRILYGSRVTLSVVGFALVLAASIGWVVGLASGYFGGKVDAIVMRIVDAVIAFPFLILVLTLVAVLGPSARNAAIAIAVANAPLFVRFVRGEVLKLRELEYVAAAKTIGVSTAEILRRHISPHLLGAFVIFIAIRSSTAIIAESGLSFLGLGVQLPTPTWGNMIAVGADYLRAAWWYSLFPGVAIFACVLSLNVIGDGLRDQLDVRAR